MTEEHQVLKESTSKGSIMSSARYTPSARRIGWGLIASSVVTIGTAAFLGTPTAMASPTPGGQSAAVITPLLTLFQFGDTVGIPEGCNTSLSVLEAVLSQSQVADQVSPLLSQIGAQCQSVSDQGAPLIADGMSAAEPASALNALVNPAIAEGSSTLGNLGSAPGLSTSPFGPTISGLSQSITFFEGQ